MWKVFAVFLLLLLTGGMTYVGIGVAVALCFTTARAIYRRVTRGTP